MKRHSRSRSLGGNDEDKLEKNHVQETKEKNSRRYTFKEYLIDYTANSNLHGLKYVGEKQRTYIEKFFWLFVLICCVVICSGLIRKVYIKWNESPVIVTFAENSTPVWQIPYPAVTVCFETKSLQTRFNFTKYYHLYIHNDTYEQLTEEERYMYQDVSMVCDDHLAPKNGRKFSDGNVMVETLRRVSPNISEFFYECIWKGIPMESCTDLFSQIVTEEGFCYTFNMLGAQELFRLENLHKEFAYLENFNTSPTWSLDDGYPSFTPLETYPHRGSGYGAKAGLTFLLQTNEIDIDYVCKGPVQGFKILLHNPAELPRLATRYFRSPLSQEVVVAVKPNMMTTSDGLKPYDPFVRQCFFPSERYLRYYKIYTQTNCDIECLTNFTNARCGCVHFGLPHGPDMKVCNAGSMACLKKAQMELVTAAIQTDFEKEMDQNDTLGEARAVAAQCKCLPACTSIEYEAEMTQAQYDIKALYAAYNKTVEDDALDKKISRVMIFFKEPQIITYRRSEMYGPTDFLANCGGLLGLFMGFSILSVAEIFYFLTLRIICNLWRKRNYKEFQDLDSLKKK